MKNRVDKLSGKTSWMIGVLFLVGLIIGHLFTSVHGLELTARHQAGKNQMYKSAAVDVVKLNTKQNDIQILLAQIQQNVKYIQRDILDIKQTLNRDKP